jgi:acyl dehydratase
MEKFLPLDEIKTLIGQEIGKTEWMRIDQERINKFADCTEDRQWIHMDPERAAKGPYGKIVAHGFLTISLLPYLTRKLTFAPKGFNLIVNYGMNKVRFIEPVPVNAMIRDVMGLKAVNEKGSEKILLTMQHTIEIQGIPKPACVLETLRLFMKGQPQ